MQLDKVAGLLAQIENLNPGLPKVAADESNVASVMTMVFGIAGAIAVLIIVIAGLNFITGGDNPEKISRSKNAIIYALIGLAIVIFAEAIVLTVLGQF